MATMTNNMMIGLCNGIKNIKEGAMAKCHFLLPVSHRCAAPTRSLESPAG